MRAVRVATLIAGVLVLMIAQLPRAVADPAPVTTSWPLSGRPTVVEGFDPPVQEWGAGHRGVDLSGQVGDPVLAAAAGTVTFAQRLAGRGVVVVQHGPLRTTYEPVTATVTVGMVVQAGEQIGTLQAGGHCSHCLHWGLRRGETYLDPLLLAPDQGAAGEIRLLAAAERDATEDRSDDRERIRDLIPPVDESPGEPGAHGFRLPVSAPITSPFGMRFHPVLHRWKLHDGTDFGAGCRTPIHAPYAGTVSQAYFNAGYGNRLMIDHGVVDGRRVVTGYNHATSYVVGSGTKISRGQLIGYVGTTGYSTGCHLHLMVWLDGRLVDPMDWF